MPGLFCATPPCDLDRWNLPLNPLEIWCSWRWLAVANNFSSVQNPGWLFDIGDYTTQLYGDYFINHEIKIPINQRGWLMECRSRVERCRCSQVFAGGNFHALRDLGWSDQPLGLDLRHIPKWNLMPMYTYGCQPKNRGDGKPPKWMVKIMEKPVKMGWFGVKPTLFLETSISTSDLVQGLLESIAFFGFYGIYLAVVLLPARLRPQSEAGDVELEAWS